MSHESPSARRGLPTAGVAVRSDRRFRRGEVAPARRRRGRLFWALLRWTVLAAGLTLAAALGTQRLIASDMFQVRNIAVSGAARLSTGDVEALLSGLRGENVFSVDFEHYRQRVLDSAWVEAVTLSRVLPATIAVTIVERRPLAIARLNQLLYLVDRTGNIIDEFRADHVGIDLPIVDGLLTGTDGATAVDPDRLSVATMLFDELASRSDLQQRVSQVDVTNPHDVVVTIDDDAAWLHLGQAAFVERLQRYLDLRPALRARFGAIEYADLKFDERIYVRGQGRPAPESLAAE